MASYNRAKADSSPRPDSFSSCARSAASGAPASGEGTPEGVGRIDSTKMILPLGSLIGKTDQEGISTVSMT
jgi:hypothetical protein